jgi:hypothetical protein
LINYPVLPTHLRHQLELITPSVDGELRYFPCLVTLRDGSTLDWVYLTAGAPHSKQWGTPTEEGRKIFWLSVDEIVDLADSPSRLPAEFANQVYRHGESGMGYTIFTVVFADQSRKSYVSGNAVDFISFPPGKTQRDVVGVLPGAGRDQNPQRTPPYKWCLFSDE